MQPTNKDSDGYLAPLRDVAGVLGSFFVDRTGAIVASDLPPMLGTELLREAGPRVLRLEETLGADGSGPESIVLRFHQQRLHLRFEPEGVFGVLAQHDVNAASLKMALTLAGRRRRGSLLAGPAVGRASAPSQASEPSDLSPDTRRSPVFSEGVRANSPAAAVPVPDDGGVIYRGRRIR
jgi:hypothetical protein